MQSPGQGGASSPEQIRFIDLAGKYCALLNQENIPATPWRDPAVPHFSQLTPAHQAMLLESLEGQIRLTGEFRARGASLLDTWNVIWAFLKEMNLKPAPDLLKFASPEDFVALYNQHQIMIFLSPNHLKFTTYSLEDLYCRPWPQTFLREPHIERMLIKRAMAFAQGLKTETESNEDISPHAVVETDSPGMRVVMTRSRAYSPLFRDGKPCGFLAINLPVAGPVPINTPAP